MGASFAHFSETFSSRKTKNGFSAIRTNLQPQQRFIFQNTETVVAVAAMAPGPLTLFPVTRVIQPKGPLLFPVLTVITLLPAIWTGVGWHAFITTPMLRAYPRCSSHHPRHYRLMAPGVTAISATAFPFALVAICSGFLSSMGLTKVETSTEDFRPKTLLKATARFNALIFPSHMLKLFGILLAVNITLSSALVSQQLNLYDQSCIVSSGAARAGDAESWYYDSDLRG